MLLRAFEMSDGPLQDASCGVVLGANRPLQTPEAFDLLRKHLKIGLRRSARLATASLIAPCSSCVAAPNVGRARL